MAPGPPTSHKRCRQHLDVGAPPPAQPHLEVVTASSPVMCDGEGFGCIKGTAVGGGYTSEHGHAEHVRRVCTSLPPNCSLCMHDDHQVKKNAERHEATLGNSAMAQGYAAYAEPGCSNKATRSADVHTDKTNFRCPLHCTPLHPTPLHPTSVHSTPLRSTITLHSSHTNPSLALTLPLVASDPLHSTPRFVVIAGRQHCCYTANKDDAKRWNKAMVEAGCKFPCGLEKKDCYCQNYITEP